MNHSLKTRVLAMILSVVMVIGLVPVSVFAEETEPQNTTPETVVVKFDVNGGDGEYEDQEVALGGKVTKPDKDPTHNSATFAYWTADLEENEEWDFEKNVVTEAMTLYAAWLIHEAETEPEVTEPEVTEPEVTEPEVTEPEVTEPEVTEPEVTEPEVTEPEATEPEVTEPEVTEPEVTEPEVTEPVEATYTVEHYLETADGYELDEDATETLTGEVGTTTAAVAKEYEGYTSNPFEQGEIAADGSTVVKIIYFKNPVVADVSLGCGLEAIGMTVIDEDKSTLAPGVTMKEIVLYDANGDRVEMQLTISDPNVDTVHFYANYKDNQCASWGMQTLSEQVAAMEANYEEPFKVVAGLNASYYNTTTGAPTGAFVMEGVDASTSGDSYAFFAVLKDGTVMIGDKGTYSDYKDQIKEAIGGYVHIVKDGAVVAGLDQVTKYPRQTIGITADGKVITMTADGSQAPKTVGLTYQEQAEVMLALGCVDALHLDGGNSATFGAVREGTDKFVTVNSPSGGAERAVSNTLMIVSTAVPDGAFDHAVVTSEYDYFVPNTSYTFGAFGVDAANGAADIPETAVWTLSDDSFGTIAEDGTFTSNGKLGDVNIQLSDNDKVVGTKVIHVVTPTAISFAGAETTVPYGKSAELPVTAMFGNSEAFCMADSFNWTVDPADAGSMEGFFFTAANESDISNATVTAAYKYDESVAVASIVVNFGKGSEVLFDFEDGDVSDWKGTDAIHAWVDNEKTKYPDATVELMYPENYVNKIENVSSSVFLATEDNGGRVKSGDYALGVKLDRLNAEGVGSWIYNYLFYTGDTQIWRDVANGKSAVRVGMWVNMPQNATNTAFRICRTFTKDSSGKLYTNFDYMKSDYDDKNVSYNTNYGVPESGWIYVYFDLTAYDFQSSLQYNPNEDYAENNGKATGNNIYPAFIQFINGTSTDDDTMEELVIYIDDITLDYSDVTDDRDAPVISNPTVCSDGSNDVALNGQTVTSNLLSFGASIADASGNSNATGLNYRSAKIYVDGMDMSRNAGFKAAGSTISLNNVYLNNGQHTITFVVCDNQGNETKVTRNVTVNGSASNATVSIAGHNDGNTTPEAGSVYYIDVKASDAAQVEAITTTLKLNSANTFEYNYLICAEGVTAKASYDALNRELTLNITHNGTQTGETVLVSVPVRVWAWDAVKTGIAASTQFATGLIPDIDVECQVVKGSITYTGSDYASYINGFAGSLDVATKLDNASAWHAHSAAAIADKAPDCTHTGYTGRTYCDGCASVINWGTTVNATGHTYEIGEDGILDCSCGETFTGIWTDGKEYVNGVCMADGWQGEVYYKDGVKLTGIHKVPAPDSADEFYYDFGEDGICAKQLKYEGLFFDESAGVYRYSKLGVVSSGWFLIGEDWYYFDANTMAAVTGTYQYTDDIVYEFAENGKIIKGFWAKNLYGTRYYYGPDNYKNDWYTIEGKDYCFEKGYRIDGGYQLVTNISNERIWYFFEEDGSCDRTKVIPDGFYTDRNGLGYSKNGKAVHGVHMIDGVNYFFDYRGYAQSGKHSGYLFGDDYKGYTGIVEENGGKYYYENGKRKMAGLIEIDGSYYFASGDGEIITDQTTYVWMPNGIIPASDRTFGADGKMLDGIIERDGNYYYYNMGKPEMAGLIEINGDYYFAKDGNGLIVTDQVYYIWKSNDIVPESEREFGPDGKMYNGIVEKDGSYYYYNMGKPEMAGLIYIDGHYYFAKDGNGTIVTDRVYYNWKSNDLLPEGDYKFGSDGKMLDGIVEIDGGYYYYVNGKPTMAGMIEFDGNYYFAKDGKGTIVTNRVYYNWKGNGLLPEGNYEFGPDGKMLDGIIERNGNYYYYNTGKPEMAGLIEIDGDYYFAKDGDGLLVTDCTYYMWKSNGIVPASDREFGPDGKMLNGIIERDGNYYYYNMGKPEMAGLIEIDGSYYFAKDGKGLIVTDQTYYIWKTNGILPESERMFGADGKMLDGFITKDDGIYYYEDGKVGTVGLNYIDGHYYFVGYDGKLVTNRTYYVWKTNGLTVAMNYTFDAQGRIML